jgi:hypothetical protein
MARYRAAPPIFQVVRGARGWLAKMELLISGWSLFNNEVFWDPKLAVMIIALFKNIRWAVKRLSEVCCYLARLVRLETPV